MQAGTEGITQTIRAMVLSAVVQDGQATQALEVGYSVQVHQNVLPELMLTHTSPSLSHLVQAVMSASEHPLPVWPLASKSCLALLTRKLLRRRF